MNVWSYEDIGGGGIPWSFSMGLGVGKFLQTLLIWGAGILHTSFQLQYILMFLNIPQNVPFYV